MNDILLYLSLAIGVIGLLFGWYEKREHIRLKDAFLDQSNVMMQRLVARSIAAKKIRTLLKSVSNNEKVSELMWTQYQGISDLYVGMVSYYLQNVGRFTYEDIARLVRNGFITTRWEESVWRDLVALRPENRARDVPDFSYPEVKKEDANNPPQGNGG